MFHFSFGDVGSGKSYVQAQQLKKLVEESKKIEKKYKLPKREIWSNTKLNEKYSTENKERLKYWKNPMEMILNEKGEIRRGIDVVWDEMAVELPSDKWQETDPEIRRFFAQHRKRGIRIYGNTQDYMMMDINARRMATHVYQIHKIVGSRDPSPTLPALKYIWGMIWEWELEKSFIRKDDQIRKHLRLLPEIYWITKKGIKLYDTSEDIAKDKRIELKHIEKECPVCGIKKVFHS